MKIPSSFRIAGFKIKVEIVDFTESNSYGCFCDSTNTIEIARKLLNGTTIIELTEDQQLSTFYHELIHVFQFYVGEEYDERRAQSYSNFLLEFNNSTEYDT